MAEIEYKPISSLSEATSFSGNEKVPFAIGKSNGSAKLGVLKEYFRDSSLVIFDEIDSNEVVTISDNIFIREPNATYAIVYLSSRKVFAERKTLNGASSYSTNFTRWQDFLKVVSVNETDKKETRTDRVFFNVENKELYIYNGSLHNLFDTVRINAMTEEEFSNLENPIEGAFYATYEE